MTYEKLLALYQRTHPGVGLKSPEEQQAFNNWTGTLQELTGAKNWEEIPDNVATNPFVDNTLGEAVNDAAVTAAKGVGESGNVSQIQVGNQTGEFETTGTTEQTGSVSNTTDQNQVGTNKTVGTTGLAGTNTTAGTSTTNVDQTVGTNGETKVVDSLGFGDLLKNQQGAAVARDATRDSVLTDVANTGGKQFNDQLMKGISSSLSGPGMQGVGVGAQGRVAGSAAADIGRNNLAQRLEATRQLGDQSAVGQLSKSADPYLGSSTNQAAKTTGTNTTNSNQTSDFKQTV